MNYEFPDKKQLQQEYLKKYGESFLILNNLKVGDIIEIEFDYQVISQKYKSREMERFGCKKLANGMLKIDENGLLYAESIEDMQFYESKSSGYGNRYKSWYDLVKRKSIFKFGTGFIF